MASNPRFFKPMRNSVLAFLFCAFSGALAETTIDLKYQVFDPLEQLPAIAKSRQTSLAKLSGVQTYLVQFERSLTPGDRDVLGGLQSELLVYVPNNAWILRTDAKNFDALRSLKVVRWIGLYEPVYKIAPDLGTRAFGSLSRRLERAAGIYDVAISVLDGLPVDSALLGAAQLGFGVEEVNTEGRSSLIRAKGTLSQIHALSEHPDVLFIEESGEARLRNDITRWVIQSNINNNNAIWSKGIRGENQIGGLIDDRVHMGHDQFRDPVNNNPGPGHRKVVAYLSGNGQGSEAHGTHTAGTFVGDRIPINGQSFRNGMAYAGRIAFRNLANISSTNLLARLEELHSYGARVHSNSWGDDGTTAYTNWCRAIDEYSWNNEEGCVAFAVTNGSSLRTPENAKSCLAVGATQQANSQQNHGSGGQGPTADGRRKPEIYAPGVGIWSAQSGTTSGWVQYTGTSMACPAISGAALLVRQYYTEGWLADGTLKPGQGFTPSGALIRSTIMNGGVDMTGVTGYPSNREGWGRLLLDNVLFFKGDKAKLLAYDRRNANGLTAGQEDTYTIVVRDSSVPLKIVMTFTDYPGAVNASNPVVNDVNLTVVGPTGTTWLGNDFDTSAGQSKTGGSVDTKNSTEVVLLKVPTKGTYRIKVRCATLNNGGKQGYALTISGGVVRLVNVAPSP